MKKDEDDGLDYSAYDPDPPAWIGRRLSVTYTEVAEATDCSPKCGVGFRVYEERDEDGTRFVVTQFDPLSLVRPEAEICECFERRGEPATTPPSFAEVWEYVCDEGAAAEDARLERLAER